MRLRLACVMGFALAALALLAAFAAPIEVADVWRLVEEDRVDVNHYPGRIWFLGEDRMLFSNERSRTTEIWEIGGGDGPERIAGAGVVFAVSGDGLFFAAAAGSGAVSIWSAGSLAKTSDLCMLESTPYPRGAFSPDGRILAVGNRRDDIELWDIATSERLAVLEGLDSNLFGVVFSSDGSFLAVAGGWSGGTSEDSSRIMIWDAETFELVADLPTIDIGDNHAIVLAQDDTRLYSGGTGPLVGWDTGSWERVYEAGAAYVGNSGLAVSPSEPILASAYHSGALRLIDLRSI